MTRRNRIVHLLGSVAALVSILTVTRPAAAESRVRITLLDGAQLTGELNEIARQSVHIDVNGESKSIAVDDISRIEFGDGRRAAVIPGDCEVLMPEGGRLVGSLGVGDPGRLMLRTSKLGPLMIPLERVAAIRLIVDDSAPVAAKIFEERLADPLAARDVLVTRGDDPKALRGSLIEIGPGVSRFTYNNRERSLQTQKIKGIVLARGVRQDDSSQNATVALAGNQRLRCRLVQGGQDGLVVDAGFDKPVTIPIQHIIHIEIESLRVTYLSDLSITTSRHQGIVHRSRAVRLDRNVANQPIRLGGRIHNKGLGMQSDTEVSFDLDGLYETFAATVGIDDAVAPRGRATFVVTVDGQARFSETISGGDGTLDLKVPVHGATGLSLRVEHAGDGDVADWTDWGSARLIRAKSSS